MSNQMHSLSRKIPAAPLRAVQDIKTSHIMYPKKNVLPEINNKSGFKYVSSLEDIPPITSGRHTISALTDDKIMTDLGLDKRNSLLTKLNEIKDSGEQNSSFLKNKSEILTDNSTRLEKNYKHSNMRLNMDNSLIMKKESDDDLSTGLDGIGFDKFAQQFGIMDASDLSPTITSPEMKENESRLKVNDQFSNLDSTPKNLLKNLFDTSLESNDKNITEIRNGDGERFFNFLKEMEELNERSSEKENSYLSNKSKEQTIESENEINSFNDEISNSKDLLKDDKDIQDDLKIFTNKYKETDQTIHEMDDIWEKNLIEKEKILKLEYEEQISQLQKKLLEEKEFEEKKINQAIELIRKENAEILAKQEQIFTEELEGELESVKVEMELKKLSALDELKSKMEEEKNESLKILLKEIEEKHLKEYREKEESIITLYDEKMQNMIVEMERNLEDKKHNIQLLHQQEIENLRQKNILELEEMKNLQSKRDHLKISDETEIATNKLKDIQESIETETETLKNLEKQKITLLEKYKNEESEFNNNLQILNNNCESKVKEKFELDEEVQLLQNRISEIKENIKKEKEILEELISEKESYQNELQILKEEMKNCQKNCLLKQKYSAYYIDKCVDTLDLFVDVDKELENVENDENIEYALKNNSHVENHSVSEHEDIKEMQNSLIQKENKVEQLVLKMDTLEKAFKLLETKIGNSIDSTLNQNETIYHNENVNKYENHKFEFPISLNSKKDDKQNVYPKSQKPAAENFNETSNINNNITSFHHLKHSAIYTPDDDDDDDINDGNSINDSYQNGNLIAKQMSSSPPIYISTSEIHLIPYKKSDFNSQLKDYRQKLNNLQAKYQTSKLKLDFIKKDILKDISEKGTQSNIKENIYKNYEQLPDNQNKMENAYLQNILPATASNIGFITDSARISQNKWNSNLLERTQQLIHKEVFHKNENKYSSNNLELELFSKKKSKRQYMSCPTLTEYYSSLNSNLSESLDLSNDYRKNVYSRESTDIKPILLSKASSLGKIITEKEDWSEKIETLYHKIRESERDLILNRSIKTKI